MKKAPVFAHFVPPTVSLSAEAELCKDGPNRDQLRKAILQPLQIESIYGHILQKTTFDLLSGEPFTWEYVNPFALLHQLTAWRPRFGDMLREAMRAECVQFVYYMDETKPGNILRPDEGRSLACFYWSIMGLPSWFRSRHCGWFFFGLFPESLQDQLPGGYSFLFSFMVKTFFGKGALRWDFSTSGVCCKTTSGNMILKGSFGVLLADEKAMKELWCTKGASTSRATCARMF